MSRWPSAVASLIVILGACSAPVDRQFSFSTDAPCRTGLTPVATGVLVGNEAGKLFHLGPGGTVRWQAALGREIASRTVAAQGFAIAGTVAGELVAFSLDDGQERWRVADLPPITAPLVTDGERVFVLTADGSTRAFAPATGTLLWVHGTVSPTGAGTAMEATSPSPLVVDGLLVFAHADSGVVALRVEDGATTWRHPMRRVVGVSADSQHVYAAGANGEVVALSRTDGEPSLSSAHKGRITAGPYVALERIWVATDAPALLALDPQDGKERERFALPGPVLGTPASAGELLLVPIANRQGQLLAFRPPAAQPVATLSIDSPLRTSPLVIEDDVLVTALDGRVIGLKLKRARR